MLISGYGYRDEIIPISLTIQWVLRSAVGMTHSLRSDLWWTIPFHALLDHFGIPIGSLTIDQTYLSIEAQCVSHYYPRWTATVSSQWLWFASLLALAAEAGECGECWCGVERCWEPQLLQRTLLITLHTPTCSTWHYNPYGQLETLNTPWPGIQNVGPFLLLDSSKKCL